MGEAKVTPTLKEEATAQIQPPAKATVKRAPGARERERAGIPEDDKNQRHANQKKDGIESTALRKPKDEQRTRNVPLEKRTSEGAELSNMRQKNTPSSFPSCFSADSATSSGFGNPERQQDGTGAGGLGKAGEPAPHADHQHHVPFAVPLQPSSPGANEVPQLSVERGGKSGDLGAGGLGERPEQGVGLSGVATADQYGPLSGSQQRETANPNNRLLTAEPQEFRPYPHIEPDPAIHGEGPFVAALPARPRAVRRVQQLKQYPIWHPDAGKVGTLRDGVFVKKRKGGSISLIYEQQLRQRGVHGYTFTILEGQISASDGIGFVFGDRVPCSKNIKRLWSVFVNRTGHIVKRMGQQMVRMGTAELPPLTHGALLSMVLDLDQYVATFQVTLQWNGEVVVRRHIDLADMAERVDGSRGYLCAAVTKAGMAVMLSEAPSDILNMPSIPYRAQPGTFSPLALTPSNSHDRGHFGSYSSKQGPHPPFYGDGGYARGPFRVSVGGRDGRWCPSCGGPNWAAGPEGVGEPIAGAISSGFSNSGSADLRGNAYDGAPRNYVAEDSKTEGPTNPLGAEHFGAPITFDPYRHGNVGRTVSSDVPRSASGYSPESGLRPFMRASQTQDIRPHRTAGAHQPFYHYGGERTGFPTAVPPLSRTSTQDKQSALLGKLRGSEDGGPTGFAGPRTSSVGSACTTRTASKQCDTAAAQEVGAGLEGRYEQRRPFRSESVATEARGGLQPSTTSRDLDVSGVLDPAASSPGHQTLDMSYPLPLERSFSSQLAPPGLEFSNRTTTARHSAAAAELLRLLCQPSGPSRTSSAESDVLGRTHSALDSDIGLSRAITYTPSSLTTPLNSVDVGALPLSVATPLGLNNRGVSVSSNSSHYVGTRPTDDLAAATAGVSYNAAFFLNRLRAWLPPSHPSAGLGASGQTLSGTEGASAGDTAVMRPPILADSAVIQPRSMGPSSAQKWEVPGGHLERAAEDSAGVKEEDEFSTARSADEEDSVSASERDSPPVCPSKQGLLPPDLLSLSSRTLSAPPATMAGSLAKPQHLSSEGGGAP